ncbi:MAG: WYL domain-containing protein [Oscillospiraceae bacterium]|nr:WYL domain-containing protein [Oscillospiraceae bacterium]
MKAIMRHSKVNYQDHALYKEFLPICGEWLLTMVLKFTISIETVGFLEEALQQKKRVSFYYFDLNEHSEKVYRKSKERYIVEPMALVFNEDNYYLTCYSSKYDGICNYRVDRMELLAIKKQAEDIENRIEIINSGENSINELSILEREERASFKFIVENAATIIKNALVKIEFFESKKRFATNVVKLWDSWSEDYKIFKTTLKDDLKNACEDDSIESEE